MDVAESPRIAPDRPVSPISYAPTTRFAAFSSLWRVCSQRPTLFDAKLSNQWQLRSAARHPS
jgi:hypothetical protein